ncbi:MAG: phosphopyruvate hydratase [bacterium]
MKITKIQAREILDSRGNPTVEAEVFCGNLSAKASVPSGASTGTHEALELRDNDKKRFGGKGVLKAVENVNGEIAKKIVGFSVLEQEKIDNAMIALDGTENKNRLGANAILAVSLAAARAGAMAENIPLYKYINKSFFRKDLDSRLRGNDGEGSEMSLPQPMMNILNGGAHAGWVADFQEFMILPRHKLLSERVRMGAEVFHILKDVLKKRGLGTQVGDEGGYAPVLKNNEDGFKLIIEAIKKAGYKPGKDVDLAIDVAASEFFAKGKYNLKRDKKVFSAGELLDFYKKILKKYPIVSIEDGFAEDDWDAWKDMTSKFKIPASRTAEKPALRSGFVAPENSAGRQNSKFLLVGDDLFVTNAKRLQKGIDMGVANAILIKVNQIGSLSETIGAIKLAQKNNYKVVISHRSGETADTFIADLAVGCGAEYIKTGSLSRSERVEKYNRLMEIEKELQ